MKREADNYRWGPMKPIEPTLATILFIEPTEVPGVRATHLVV